MLLYKDLIYSHLFCVVLLHIEFCFYIWFDVSIVNVDIVLIRVIAEYS